MFVDHAWVPYGILLLGLIAWGGFKITPLNGKSVIFSAIYQWGVSLFYVVGVFIAVNYLIWSYLVSVVSLPFTPSTC